MKVFVLISTIDQGITKVPAVLLPREEDVQYVVCWQRTEKGRQPDGGPSGSIPGNLREEEKCWSTVCFLLPVNSWYFVFFTCLVVYEELCEDSLFDIY